MFRRDPIYLYHLPLASTKTGHDGASGASDMAGKATKGSGRAWREQPRYNSKSTDVESDETEAGVCVRLRRTAFDAIPVPAHPELWSSRTSERAGPDRSHRSRLISICARDLRRLTRLLRGSRVGAALWRDKRNRRRQSPESQPRAVSRWKVRARRSPSSRQRSPCSGLLRPATRL